MSQMKRILVPTDFSAPSDLSLAYAIELAAGQNRSVHLLHVVDDSKTATAYPNGYYVQMLGLRAKLIEGAMDRLKGRAARCEAAGIATTMDVIIGRPDRAIVESAASRGTDLIVMGTHGRSGFAHLLIGSVAERVVRTAPCPVLTVRHTARVDDLLAAPVAGTAAMETA